VDVTVREDDCRIGKDYGAENISWLRRLAISIVRNHTKTKGSIRSKRARGLQRTVSGGNSRRNFRWKPNALGL